MSKVHVVYRCSTFDSNLALFSVRKHQIVLSLNVLPRRRYINDTVWIWNLSEILGFMYHKQFGTVHCNLKFKTGGGGGGGGITGLGLYQNIQNFNFNFNACIVTTIITSRHTAGIYQLVLFCL